MPERIQSTFKDASKFGIKKIDFFTKKTSQGVKEEPAITSTENEKIEINPQTAEDILKEKGTQIVDLLRKAVPFSKMELTIDREFIRYYEQAIPEMFGINTSALREICEDLIARTGFESFTLKATSENEEKNRLDMYIRFDRENELAQRSVNSETDLNYLHFAKEIHVTGVLTKENYRTITFEGVKYLTHKNEEYTVDKLLLLHSEEGSLIKMKENNYVAELDIKEIANFYHYNADKIDAFQKGINVNDITKHEALKTLINVVMTSRHLPAGNHIVIQKKYGSNELDLVYEIVNNAISFSTDVTGGYDLVNRLTELEISPGKLKLGFHDSIESSIIKLGLLKKGRYVLGKSIQSSSADKSLKFYSSETKFYSTISVNPNFNPSSLHSDGYYPEQNQLLFDGIYVSHDFGSQQNNYATMYGMSYRTGSKNEEDYGIIELPFNSKSISDNNKLLNRDVMGVIFTIRE